jgi:hypothetical protein
MGSENEVKVDATSQAKTEDTTLVTNLPKDSKPTSFVVSKKNELEPLRPTKTLLSDNSIHFVHIVIFVLLLFVLFAGMWTKGKKTNF